MKYKFPLDNVLRYRKTLENIAQKDMQEALSEMNRQIQILHDMQEEVIKARNQSFELQVQGGRAGAHLMQVQDFMRGQDVRMEKQRTKIKEWAEKVEELREILRLKAIDYKIIEGLKDRRAAEFKKQMARLDQKAADDQTTMRHRREEE